MAKLPIDWDGFVSEIDFTNIEVVEKDAGILARQFTPSNVSYTGNSFLSVNGGTGFRVFNEGSEATTKNKKDAGDASATIKNIPCITLYDIIKVDRKLFKVYDAGIERDVTVDYGDQDLLEFWTKSQEYSDLQEAIKAAVLQNATRAIDTLGFYGVDAYGNAVPQITGANTTSNIVADANASDALVGAGSEVGNPVFGATSNTFAASLRKSEDAKQTGANRITFGNFDYDGISISRGDTVNSNEAFVYGANAFKWGIAGSIDGDILREATLPDGTVLALSQQYGIRVDIYLGAYWDLNKVAKATTTTTKK